MAVRIALLLLIVGCSTSKTAEHDLHVVQQQDLVGTEQMHVDTTTQQGPETITTTVEEFAYADMGVAGADGGVIRDGDERRISTDGEARQETRAAVDRGLHAERVIRRTVTVDQRGPITETTHVDLDAGVTVQTSATLEGHDKSDKEMKPAAGCMLGLGFWGAIAIAAALAVAALYLKLRPRL